MREGEMALTEQYFDSDALHPIDLVESVATHREWEFDRLGDNQIAMAVEAQWRTYAITLAWAEHDHTLRLISTFDMDPPQEKLPAVYEMLNAVNDKCWAGTFTWWQEQKLMVFRYGLNLAGDQIAGTDQIDSMIRAAVDESERYYPAFQLVTWGDQTPMQAMQVAMTEAYGRA